MPSSATDICNRALARIGNQQFITHLDTEASQQADLCRLFYEQSRDRLLEEFPWPFATRFDTLQLVEEADEQPWADQWDYAYKYPVECLRVRRILTANGPRDPDPAPFEVGQADGVRLIFTNESEAKAEYTLRAKDTAMFDPLFVSALSWLIAFEIALPLSVKNDLRRAAFEGYMVDLNKAAAKWANEGQPPIEPESSIVRARS